MLPRAQGGTFILYGEATLTPPDNETLAAELAAPSAANASGAPADVSASPAPMCVGEGTTAWLGCALVTVPAIMSERVLGE